MGDAQAPPGEVAAERRAITSGAALAPPERRAALRATGPDRVEFLNGMLTNDIARLEPGRACPALLLTIQGRVTGDVDAWCDADALWLLVGAPAAEEIRTALGRLIVADEVEIVPAEDHVVVEVVGPAAPRLVPEAEALAPWTHAPATIGGAPVRVLRGAPLAPDDVTIIAPRAQQDAVRAALLAAGAAPCGPAVFEARRIELGVPRLGADMGPHTLAIELPLEARISTTKGCYLGQEVVARGTQRGRVQRRLCGFVFDGPPPAPGATLLADGAPAGTVTSVAAPPAAAAPVGLGFVRRDHWEPGTVLRVAESDPPVTARVAAFPLA